MAWYAKFQDIDGSSAVSERDTDTLVFDRDSERDAGKSAPKLLEACAQGTFYPIEDGPAELANVGIDAEGDGIANAAHLPELPVEDFLF